MENQKKNQCHQQRYRIIVNYQIFSIELLSISPRCSSSISLHCKMYSSKYLTVSVLNFFTTLRTKRNICIVSKSNHVN